MTQIPAANYELHASGAMWHTIMKTHLFFLFILFIQLPLRAQSDYPKVRISEDVELIKLSEKAYVHVSVSEIDGFGKVSSNGLILVCKDEAFLFDTPVTDSQTETLVKWIADSLNTTISSFIGNIRKFIEKLYFCWQITRHSNYKL
ncbi:hypothetical protein FACS189451_09810 [Bacteroidia bacterium]|nr:hypothetical protein FACS189451_09810 [Bacteroidia bacterium]